MGSLPARSFRRPSPEDPDLLGCPIALLALLSNKKLPDGAGERRRGGTFAAPEGAGDSRKAAMPRSSAAVAEGAGDRYSRGIFSPPCDSAGLAAQEAASALVSPVTCSTAVGILSVRITHETTTGKYYCFLSLPVCPARRSPSAQRPLCATLNSNGYTLHS